MQIQLFLIWNKFVIGNYEWTLYSQTINAFFIHLQLSPLQNYPNSLEEGIYGQKMAKDPKHLQQMKLKSWASWNIVGETSFLDIKLWTKLRDYLYIVSVYQTCDLHYFTTSRICFHMKDRVNLWLKLTGLPVVPILHTASSLFFPSPPSPGYP